MNLFEGNIKDIVENNAVAVSTVFEDGTPHCVAVGFAKVITDNFMSETIENLKVNPNVALAVWTRNWEDECEGYEIRGNAKYFQDGELMEKIRNIAENEGMPCKGAILVEVDRVKRLA